MSKKGNWRRNGHGDDFRIPLVRIIIIPNTDTYSGSWAICAVSVLRPGEDDEHVSQLCSPSVLRRTDESRVICIGVGAASSYIRRKFTDLAVVKVAGKVVALCVNDPTHVQRPFLEQCKRLDIKPEVFK